MFILEFDNFAYQIGLDEQVRSRVEERGRVQLTEDQTAALARSKTMHMVLLSSSVFFGLRLMNSGTRSLYNPGVGLPFVSLYLAAAVEAVLRGTTPKEKALELLKTIGLSLGGALFFGIMFVLEYGGLLPR
eukprot:SAG22_NODE_45_length_24718_cov_12.462448_6_plen_131_part_00